MDTVKLKFQNTNDGSFSANFSNFSNVREITSTSWIFVFTCVLLALILFLFYSGSIFFTLFRSSTMLSVILGAVLENEKKNYLLDITLNIMYYFGRIDFRKTVFLLKRLANNDNPPTVSFPIVQR